MCNCVSYLKYALFFYIRKTKWLSLHCSSPVGLSVAGWMTSPVAGLTHKAMVLMASFFWNTEKSPSYTGRHTHTHTLISVAWFDNNKRMTYTCWNKHVQVKINTPPHKMGCRKQSCQRFSCSRQTYWTGLVISGMWFGLKTLRNKTAIMHPQWWLSYQQFV